MCACLRACVRVCVCVRVGGGGGSLLFLKCFLLRIWAPQGAAIVVCSLPVKSRKCRIGTYLVIWPHVTFRPCSWRHWYTLLGTKGSCLSRVFATFKGGLFLFYFLKFSNQTRNWVKNCGVLFHPYRRGTPFGTFNKRRNTPPRCNQSDHRCQSYGKVTLLHFQNHRDRNSRSYGVKLPCCTFSITEIGTVGRTV